MAFATPTNMAAELELADNCVSVARRLVCLRLCIGRERASVHFHTVVYATVSGAWCLELDARSFGPHVWAWRSAPEV